MTVLARLIQEREEWAALYRQSTESVHRNRFFALVEYTVLLILGLLAVLYYHKILEALSRVINV